MDKIQGVGIFIFVLTLFLSCSGKGIDEDICTQADQESIGIYFNSTSRMQLRMQIIHTFKDGTQRLDNILENIDNETQELAIFLNEGVSPLKFYFFGKTSESIETGVIIQGEQSGIKVCSIENFTWYDEQAIANQITPEEQHYFSSYTLLMGFNKVVKIDDSEDNGIKVEVWKSCLYIENMDMTLDVKYFMTSKMVNTPLNEGFQTPIKIEIIGRQNHSEETRFQETILYSHVRYGHVSPNVFELRRGTFCPNRKRDEEISLVKFQPQYFSTSVEFVYNLLGYIMVDYVKWWSDYNYNISRFDVRPRDPTIQPFALEGILPIQRNIFDQTLGLRFIITEKTRQCKVIDITPFPNDFDLSYIRQFYEQFPDALSWDMKYKYQGPRTERGITCHVLANETLYTDENGTSTESVEELLISRDKVSINSGRTAENGVPIKYQIVDQQGIIRLEYNFFDFDEEVEKIYGFDLSSCASSSKQYEFYLTDLAKDKVMENPIDTSYVIHEALAKAGNVSPLRISKVTISFEADAPKVSYLIFSFFNSKEPSIDQVDSKIKNGLSSQEMKVFNFNNTLKTFEIKFDARRGIKLKIPPSGYSGYTSGDMGGLAIGMIIIGIFVAVGLIYVFSLYNIAGFNYGIGAKLFAK